MTRPGAGDDGRPAIDALPGLLERLERHWELLGVPLATIAAPGLTDEQIDELMAPVGMHLTEELRIWFRWHDGHTSPVSQDTEAAVVAASWATRKLAYCVDLTIKYRASDPLERRRRQSWFHFCERGGAKETLAAELGAPGQAQGAVYWADVEMSLDEAPQLAASLTQLVQLWVERLDNGRPTLTWQGSDWARNDEPSGLLNQGRFG